VKPRCVLRASMGLAVCLLLAVPSVPQSGLGNIGPSKGQAVAAIVAAAVVVTGVGILVYYKVHKHAAIVGCVVSDQNGFSLKTAKGDKTYLLSGDSGGLRAGHQVALKGRRIKEPAGKLTLQVQKLVKDYGECKP
jgi:hypothetical protein